MAYNFLTLTNRCLKALNEVQMTSATFSTNAVGFHAEAQDAVNRAILDIYTEEDTNWPFAWSETTFTTTIGTLEYSKLATFTTVDWDSFYIKNIPIAVTSITQTAGTATVTSTTPHQLITGDVAIIAGANETEYNGSKTVTVLTSTTFTFTVDSSTTSPATGTITSRPPYESRKLNFRDYKNYLEDSYTEDLNSAAKAVYSYPEFVVRKPDNNFIISGVPDRVYTITYSGFTLPDALVNYDDVPVIPDDFEQAIIDKALHYLYMFRDNLEQSAVAQDRYEKNVNKIRRILIPQFMYMTFET